MDRIFSFFFLLATPPPILSGCKQVHEYHHRFFPETQLKLISSYHFSVWDQPRRSKLVASFASQPRQSTTMAPRSGNSRFLGNPGQTENPSETAPITPAAQMIPHYPRDHSSSLGLGSLFDDSSARAPMHAPMADAQYVRTAYDDVFANLAPGAQGNGFSHKLHDEYQVQEFTYPDPGQAFNIMPHPYAGMSSQNAFQQRIMPGATCALESTPEGSSSSSQGTGGRRRRRRLRQQDSPTNNRKRASKITAEPLRLVPLTAARTGLVQQPITNTAISASEPSEAPQAEPDFFGSLDPALFAGPDAAHDSANLTGMALTDAAPTDAAQTTQPSRLRVWGPMRWRPLTQEEMEYDDRHYDPSVSEPGETTIIIHRDIRHWKMIDYQAQPFETGEPHPQASGPAGLDGAPGPEIPGPSESSEAAGASAPLAHEESLFFQDSDDD